MGPILAARIIGTVGSVGRFPSKAHFASYSGTAPLEASSGKAVRHRLSLAGNRKLNYARHMVATCQARSDTRSSPNDLLCGGSGRDTLSGGIGDDTLGGGKGADGFSGGLEPTR